MLQGAREGGPGEVIKQVAPVALPSPGLGVDLGEVQVDDIVSGGEGDAFIQPPAELLHGSGHFLTDDIDDIIFLVPGVQLGASLYEEPHILQAQAGCCKGKNRKKPDPV